MKIETPQIAWHYEIENITCVDFHPQLGLLAVGGSDSTGQNIYLRIWNIDLKMLEEKSGTADIKKDSILEPIFKLECQLDRGHSSTINSVNFSPCGLFIATGGDDNRVVIWTEKIRPKEFGSSEMIKAWADLRELTGHSKEVYDVRWFSDSKLLVSASLDFRAVIWDTENGNILQILDGHSNYVKGCCVDPTGLHIMTQSTDRTIKIFKSLKQKKQQFICKSSVRRMKILSNSQKQANEMDIEVKEDDYFKLFLDENMVETFFRRPDWSPDGSFFLVPASQYQTTSGDAPINCVLGFTRVNLVTPSLCLPMKSKPAILVRFCSRLFRRTPDDFNMFNLPYHMVWAVATSEKIMVYSSRSPTPLIILSNIHFGCLTSLSWFGCYTLAISSMDGYISFGFFSPEELGEELEEDKYPQFMRDLAKEIDTKRENAKKDKAENKKIVIEGKQKTIYKNGKKMIIPSKVIMEDVTEAPAPRTMDEEKIPTLVADEN